MVYYKLYHVGEGFLTAPHKSCCCTVIHTGYSVFHNSIAPLKVRQSRKQIMVSSILPKNESWDNFQYIKLSQRLFFGRFEDTINCFRNLLIFSFCLEIMIMIKIGSHSCYPIISDWFHGDKPKWIGPNLYDYHAFQPKATGAIELWNTL